MVAAVLGIYLLGLVQPPISGPPVLAGCEPYAFKPTEKVCIRIIDNATKDLSTYRIATSVNTTYNLSLLWIGWRAGVDTQPPGYNGTMHFLILYKNGTTFDCADTCFSFGFGNTPVGFKAGDAVSEEIAFFVFLADERARPPGVPYDPSTVNRVHLYFTRDDTLAVVSDTVEVVLLNVSTSFTLAAGRVLDWGPEIRTDARRLSAAVGQESEALVRPPPFATPLLVSMEIALHINDTC